MVLVTLLSSACSVDLDTVAFAGSSGDAAAAGVTVDPDAPVVRETSFMEFLVSQDIARPFERSSMSAAGLTMQPGDVVLSDDRIVETSALAGWAFEHDNTELFVVPGEPVERPDAIGFIIDQSAGFRPSDQEILLASLAVAEEEAIADDAVLRLAGGSRQAAEFIGVNFTVRLAEHVSSCLLYTSPSPRDATLSRMPSSA